MLPLILKVNLKRKPRPLDKQLVQDLFQVAIAMRRPIELHLTIKIGGCTVETRVIDKPSIGDLILEYINLPEAMIDMIEDAILDVNYDEILDTQTADIAKYLTRLRHDIDLWEKA